MLEGLLGRPGVARHRDHGNQLLKEQVDCLRKGQEVQVLLRLQSEEQHQLLATFVEKVDIGKLSAGKKMGKCLLYGSQDHRVNNCPRTQGTSAHPTPSVPAARERPARGDRPKMAARVYAIDWSETGSNAEVVEGTLSISGKPAKVLLDPGSTHSFIRPAFMRKIELGSKMLPYIVEVSIPTGNEL